MFFDLPDKKGSFNILDDGSVAAGYANILLRKQLNNRESARGGTNAR